MVLEGIIKAIGETQTFGENGFRKREMVITTQEQYPQHILIEFIQDKCDIVGNFAVGSNVKVNINIRGREWVNPQGETKYFNTIQGWRIEYGAPLTGQNQGQPPVPPTEAFQPQEEFNEDDHDDLPF